MPTTPAASSPEEPSTPAHDESSDAQETASTTTSTTSWTRLLQTIDPSTLSPQNQAIKILIGDKITEGYNLTEIAKKLGRTPSWVFERLSALRDGLLLQNDLFYPLTDHEYESLKASIAQHGVQVPVIIGQHIPLIDGRHRILASQELGHTDIPAILVTGLDHEQERQLAIALNSVRRQLTRAQKRALVESELMRHPEHSDRRIAATCGVHWDTVGAARRDIAQAQALQHQAQVAETDSGGVEVEATTHKAPALLETPKQPPIDPPVRIGRDGVTQPASKPPRTPAEPPAPHTVGHALCEHGTLHTIQRTPQGTYTIAPTPPTTP